MDKFQRAFEQFRVHANDLADKIAELIHEGNVRRIIIKDDRGHTFLEIPLTVATVGVLLAPVLAAVGALATIVSRFEVVVERTSEDAASAPGEASAATATDPSVGATEDKVDMKDTVPQHTGPRDAKVEDIAGTGEHDSLGG